MGTGRSGLTKGIKNTTNKLYTTWARQSEAEKTLQRDINIWNKRTTKEALAAVHRYTGSFYTTSNPILRRDEGLSRDEVMHNIEQNESASFIEWTKNMDKALDAYDNNTAFMGYRGAGWSILGGHKTKEELKAMVGKSLHDPGHMSVSTVKGHEFSTKPVIYEVMVPKGKGIGAYVGQLSQHKSEAEFLLNRGTIFTIVNVRWHNSQPIVTLKVHGRY